MSVRPRLLPAILAGNGLPAAALAHVPAAGAERPWALDPWVLLGVLLPLGLAALAYGYGAWRGREPAWRVACFSGGMLTLFIALVWPLDPLAGRSFAAHMGQHMLLMIVAPPLLLLARPLPAMLRARPELAGPVRWARRGRWQALARPNPAFVLHGLAIWAWHAPRPYTLALQSEPVHILEHLSFLGTGLLFWWGVVHAGSPRGIGYGAAALLVLGTLMHTGLLGAVLTFAPRPLYPIHEAESALAGGLAPLADQQLAGLLMWVPGGFAYLLAGLVLAGAWLRAADRASRATKLPGYP